MSEYRRSHESTGFKKLIGRGNRMNIRLAPARDIPEARLFVRRTEGSI